MEQSYRGKLNKYHDLKAALVQAGYSIDYYVMCFGSLGCVHKDVRGNLRKLGLTHEDTKATMKWCGVSNMINSNIIWKNRCKQVTNSENKVSSGRC